MLNIIINRIHKLLMFFRDLSLQYKLLFVFVSFIVIPVCLIVSLSHLKFSNMMMENARVYMSHTLEQTAVNVDIQLENIENISKNIFMDAEVQVALSRNKESVSDIDKLKYDRSVNKVLSNALIASDYIRSIYLYASNGEVYSASYVTNQSMSFIIQDIEVTDIYQKAMSGNGSVVWLNTDRNQKAVPLVREIIDVKNFKPLGVLIINFKEDRLSHLYSKIESDNGCNIMIAESDSRIISATNKDLLDSVVNEDISTDKAFKSKSGYFTKTVNGEKTVIFFTTSSHTGWKFISTMPYSNITRQINVVKYWVWVISVLCTIAAVLMSVFFSRGITRPVKKLVDLMKRFKNGNFDVIMDYDRYDEVGELSQNFNSMVKEIDNLIKKNYMHEITNKEAEFKALQAQINPHFLYNTLESINWIARLNGVTMVCDMTKALGSLMRASIDNRKKLVSVEEELTYIDYFITIEKIRFGERLSVEIQVDKDIYPMVIPKFLIQPIIENAIKHGIQEKIGEGHISLTGSIQDDKVIFTVKDDGVGMNESKIAEILSGCEGLADTEYDRLGVANVSRRIKFYYGDKYGLSIKSKLQKGTEVSIILPFGEVRSMV